MTKHTVGACVCVTVGVGTVSVWSAVCVISHLKLLFFGCQRLVNKPLNPQCLQLYFLTHVHQLVLKTHTRLNKQITKLEHHHWRERERERHTTRKSCLLKKPSIGWARKTSCEKQAHPRRNYQVCRSYYTNHQTSCILNKVAPYFLPLFKYLRWNYFFKNCTSNSRIQGKRGARRKWK